MALASGECIFGRFEIRQVHDDSFHFGKWYDLTEENGISSWAEEVEDQPVLKKHYRDSFEDLLQACTKNKKPPPEHCFYVYSALVDGQDNIRLSWMSGSLYGYMLLQVPYGSKQHQVRILTMSVCPNYLDKILQDSNDPLRDAFVEVAKQEASRSQSTSLVAEGKDDVQQQYYEQCDWAWQRTSRFLWTYKQALPPPNPTAQTRNGAPRSWARPSVTSGPRAQLQALLPRKAETKASNKDHGLIELEARLREEMEKRLKAECIKSFHQVEARLQEEMEKLKAEVRKSRQVESNLKKGIEKLKTEIQNLHASQIEQATPRLATLPTGTEASNGFCQMEDHHPMEQHHRDRLSDSTNDDDATGTARKNDLISPQSDYCCYEVRSTEWSALEPLLQDWADQLDTRQSPFLSAIPKLYGNFAESLAIARKAEEQHQQVSTALSPRKHHIYVVADANGVCAGLLHLVIRKPTVGDDKKEQQKAEIWGVCMHPSLLLAPAGSDRMARNALLNEARKVSKTSNLTAMTASNADVTATHYFQLRPWVWRQLNPVARPNDWTDQFFSNTDDVLTSSEEPVGTWNSLREMVEQWQSSMDRYLSISPSSNGCAAVSAKYKNCVKNLGVKTQTAAGNKHLRLRVCATKTQSGECMGVLLLVTGLDLSPDSRNKTAIFGLCTHPSFWQSPDLSAGHDYAVQDSLIGQAEYIAETQRDFVLTAMHVGDPADAAYFASRDWNQDTHHLDIWTLQLASPITTDSAKKDMEMDDVLKGYVLVNESDLQ